MSGPLSRVLVMLAPYGAERPSTSQFVSRLQNAGANVLRAQAKAEVSLTRNVLAGAAYDVLRRAPELEWVFWLDQDVSGEPGNIEAMMLLSTYLGELGESSYPPSMTGLYVNRYSRPQRLALYAMHGLEPIVIPGREHPLQGEQAIECVPVLAGMGCLLQHRSTFMAHCDESAHFVFPNKDTLVPEVCTSHRIHSSELARYLPINPDEDLYYWQSEDFDYCAREWKQGRQVLSTPFAFGHECDRILVPDGETVFPGLRPPGREEGV